MQYLYTFQVFMEIICISRLLAGLLYRISGIFPVKSRGIYPFKRSLSYIIRASIAWVVY